MALSASIAPATFPFTGSARTAISTLLESACARFDVPISSMKEKSARSAGRISRR